MKTRTSFLVVLAAVAFGETAAATFTLYNAMAETAYVEVSGGGLSLAVRVPPSVSKSYSFNAVPGDVSVYLETGSFGGLLESLGSVGSAEHYFVTLQGWGTTFDPEPSTLQTPSPLPAPVESREVFVMGMVLAATIRVVRAGLRWVKRAAADSGGSGE